MHFAVFVNVVHFPVNFCTFSLFLHFAACSFYASIVVMCLSPIMLLMHLSLVMLLTHSPRFAPLMRLSLFMHFTAGHSTQCSCTLGAKV